jgi:VIT1/CCC1 family predicted Fe2+/Mn2+ transporter
MDGREVVCPHCSRALDLEKLAGGAFDYQTADELKEHAQGVGCIVGGMGGLIALFITYQFYGGAVPIGIGAITFAVFFAISYLLSKRPKTN